MSETWHLNMDIHPRSRINYFRLCFNNCRLAGFPSGEYDLYVFSTKVFSCVIQMTVQHNKKAREYFLFCLLRSPFVFARGFRTNLEQAEKNFDLITQKSDLFSTRHYLPALSSVLQVMRTSHSASSIVEAIALA